MTGTFSSFLHRFWRTLPVRRPSVIRTFFTTVFAAERYFVLLRVPIVLFLAAGLIMGGLFPAVAFANVSPSQPVVIAHSAGGSEQKEEADTSVSGEEISGHFDTVDGRLVYHTENGELLKNDSIGTFRFDAEGYYTTGDEEIDGAVAKIVAENTEESMTQEEKLSALYYDFMLLQCSYRMGDLHEKGEEGWQLDAVKTMISKNFRGNCYSYAALFRELARAVGYPAEAYSGTVRGETESTTPHGWVEIEINGELYLFDSEMQFFNGVDMYCMPAESESTIRWGYDRTPETQD